MLRLSIVLTIVLLVTPGASGDDAAKVFETLYGSKIRQVSATGDRADDVALAMELLEVAGKSGSTPGLQALMCDTAYDLGIKHPDGYTAAIAAMQLVAESHETKRSEAREKMIDILSRKSRIGKPEERDAASDVMINLLATIGDELMEKKEYLEAAREYRRALILGQQRKTDSLDAIKEKFDRANARDRTEKKLALLTEKLQGDANDSATAEEIVKLQLMEFDDPTAASQYLDRVKDENLKIHAQLAAKSLAELDGDASMKLGEWYFSLGRPPTTTEVQHRMWRRANGCFQHFLSLPTGEELKRTQADIRVAEIKKTFGDITSGDTRPSQATQPTPAVPPKTTARAFSSFASIKVDATWAPVKVVSKDTPSGEKWVPAWFDVPKGMEELQFTKPKAYQGSLAFTIEKAGKVLLAVPQQDWGNRSLSGGPWKDEVQSREQLKSMGWNEVQSLNGDRYLLLQRDCKAGETFTIRTKKYDMPILFIPRGGG